MYLVTKLSYVTKLPDLTVPVSGIQWARKVYAAVAENYANSKCYISGQSEARKALFSAFDAAWAGVSHHKISALKNV
jgi:hypothetical protein